MSPPPLRIEVKGTGPDRPDDSPALKVEVTSEPRSMAAGSSTPDTYGLGETIVITAIAGVPVTVAGDPVFRFLLTNPDEADNIIRQATYDATRSRGRAFAFAYTVQADDRDTDGIEVRDHTRTFLLDEDDRIFTTSQNIDIDRTYEHTIAYKPAEPQGDRLPNHKVDGSLAPAVTVPSRPTRPTLASATTTTLTVEWTHPGDGGSPLLRNAVRYRILNENRLDERGRGHHAGDARGHHGSSAEYAVRSTGPGHQCDRSQPVGRWDIGIQNADEHRADGGAGDYRHGGARAATDGLDHGHLRRRRAAVELLLPVGAGCTPTARRTR